MLDLLPHNGPVVGGEGIGAPELSADGEHVVWEYNNTGLTGLVWRDLRTGTTREYMGIDDNVSISGDGQFVVYDTPLRTRSGRLTGWETFLLDTKTGRTISVDRSTPNAFADDGSTSATTGLQISSDGRFVVFDSDSRALAARAGRHCGRCGDEVYLYDRVTGSLDAAPVSSTTRLSRPTVSSDGSVVAFQEGQDVGVWYPGPNTARELDPDDFTCAGDGSQALSGDGTVLARNCAFQVTAVKLGGPDGPDSVEWTYKYARPTYDTDVALSQDGGVLAMFGDPGPTGWGLWPVYRVSLPSGVMVSLPAPRHVSGLAAERHDQDGMAFDRVSLNATGTEIAAASCVNGAPAGRRQQCPVRTDVFRWSTPEPASADWFAQPLGVSPR
jgi:hypothetical protein